MNLDVSGLFALVTLVGLTDAAVTNLLKNGDFENPNSILPWECISCRGRGVQDSLEGYWSVMVSERGQSFSAFRQPVSTSGDENYIFKCYIKFLNNPRDKMYANVHVYVTYIERGNYIKKRFVDMPRQRIAFDWTEVGGDVYIPVGVRDEFSISIEIPDHDVDYLIDDASLIVMPHDVNWKATADSEIDRLRKATLTLTPRSHHNSDYYCSEYGGSYCIDIRNMHVEIKQTKSQYAFGSSVLPEYLIGDDAKYNYKQFVEKNFEWTLVHELMNWSEMEPTDGNLSNNTQDLQTLLQYMSTKHKKTWGSGLFSALRGENPEWLKQISVHDIRAAIQNRINTTADEMRGRFDNLDVYRDMLQDDFFERLTQSPNISMELFRLADKAFRSERLLLDEQNVFNSSLHTTAYKNMAYRFNASHVRVDGLGIIAVFNTSKVNMDVLKYRLDKLAEVGYPLWISSLSIHNHDVAVRASILDDVMTLLYSRPEVKGICLDDVWDGVASSIDSSLATGSNFSMNAAGRVYENRWHTHEYLPFTSTIRPRVYKGNYDIIIRNGRNGSPIHTHHITVGDSGESLVIHVTGQGQNYHVSNVVG